MNVDFPSRLQLMGEPRPGGTVEARWIVRHPMHSGLRVDDGGQRIPRNIIESVRVFLGSTLFLEIEPGIGLSVDPFLSFTLPVPQEAVMVAVEWRDDQGRSGRVQQWLRPG